MARYTGAKDRLSRREGVDLFGKGSKLTRVNVTPGQHGPKGYRSSSQFGKQLREKQKVKRIYGVLEKQFKRYVNKAFKSKGNTGEALLVSLEKRLDNVVYRLGFVPTRPMARQLVGHGHVTVDGKKVTIPSFSVKVGQTVSLGAKAIKMPVVALRLAKEEDIVSWLEKKATVGKIKREPKREDIIEPIFEKDIVEYYSR